jgi:hypothetical protein
MDLSPEQVSELKQMFASVAVTEEAGVPFLFFENVLLPDGCTPNRVDLLLCPVQHNGYPTRLYFSQRISSPKPPNWNGEFRICDRRWFAYSWNIPNGINLRLSQMVLEHMRALR